MTQQRTPVNPADTSAGTSQMHKADSIPLRIFAICLTSVVVAVHYTNYGPLIPTLINDLHISSGQTGLFSTFLFSGLAVMYIPAGTLADRYGQRPVLIGSSVLLVLGAVLLPLSPNLFWILVCRFIVGLGAGAAFVAGASVAAGLGKHASLGQGLYGGSVQIGSGLGLLLTPHLLTYFGWRGSFLFWGLLGIASIIIWLFVSDGHGTHAASRMTLKAGLRSRAIWTLGLSHMGTFGLGNALAAWIAVYFAFQYGISLGLAATLGSLALLTGIFFRPLGGILIARRVIGAIPLLRIGTILGCLGVGLLAIPLRFPPLAILGTACIAIGTTIPYTSVFNEAAHLRDIGKGVAQGLVSMISTPTVLLGPPLIGLLFGYTHDFVLAFVSIMLFGCVAITASFLAGSAVKREKVQLD
jgi:nitrate/nitrite transporter NarK